MAEVTWAVTLEGETYELTLAGASADGVYLLTASIDGKHCGKSQVSLHHVHGDKYMVSLDDQNTSVFLNRVPDGYKAVLQGHEFVAQVEEARIFHLKREMAASRERSEPAEIVAPMPGLVLAVEVEEGQEVAEGEGVVVVESMKMENEIKATMGGMVEKVMVETGQIVDKGEALVRVVPHDDL